jgi:cell wall-associated NlpC family hydrolase
MAATLPPGANRASVELTTIGPMSHRSGRAGHTGPVRSRRLLIVGLICAACGGCGQQAGGSGTRSTARSSGPAASSAAGAASDPAAVGLRPHPQVVEPVAGAAAPTAQPAGDPAGVNQATLTAGGLAVAPIDAPAAVQEVIAAGNQIARLPYRYGGGHLTYEDTAYDCSGSLSYVLAAAHLLDQTVDSGELESWGKPGPGKWITVFANAGHTFMYVAGLRFDTVALAETGSRWTNRPADEPDLSTFVVRHPAGL